MGTLARAESRYHCIPIFEWTAYAKKPPAPDDPNFNGCVAIRLRLKEGFTDNDFVGRSGLMLNASSGTVTLSPSSLFPLLLSPPDRSLREEH
jgi:hypothetical protein